MTEETEKIAHIQDIFNQLKSEGYIDPKRELITRDYGSCIYVENNDENKIFFNKNYSIPHNDEVLSLFILHEEGHKRYPQFRKIFSNWIISLLALSWVLSMIILFQVFSPFLTMIIVIFGFFSSAGVLLHLFSKRYFKIDEINADIYGAICISKKFNNRYPSRVTRASFDFIENEQTRLNANTSSKSKPTRNFKKLLYNIWDRYLDTHPTHHERVSTIKNLIDMQY